MKTKKTLISIITLCAALSTDQELPPLKIHKKSGQNPPLKLWTIPTQSWMIYISRRTRFLQIMKMYGTRHSA